MIPPSPQMRLPLFISTHYQMCAFKTKHVHNHMHVFGDYLALSLTTPSQDIYSTACRTLSSQKGILRNVALTVSHTFDLVIYWFLLKPPSIMKWMEWNLNINQLMGSLCRTRPLIQSHMHSNTHTNITSKSGDACAVENTRISRYIVAFTTLGLCST